MRVTPLERAESLARSRENRDVETLVVETGFSERAIRRDLRVVKALAEDVREALRGAARTVTLAELVALAGLDVERQREVVGRWKLRSGGSLVALMRETGGAHVEELDFQSHVMIALGARSDMRIWRQNAGSVLVRDRRGRGTHTFHAGPPKGAADLSGVVGPEGFRLEVELKADGGKLSTEQRAWRAMIERFGGLYVVAGYEDARGLEENVAAAVRAVERAIEVRRGV